MTTDKKKFGRLIFLLGAALLALAAWGLWADLEWIAQPFYAYAWWSYILVLDGFCAMRRGHSLLTTRTRFLLPICVGSISFWFFFELLNLRFQNWYYVGVFTANSIPMVFAGAGFTMLCFATVFTGIFETYEALTAAGLWRSWRGRSGKLFPWVSYAVQGLGAVMAGVAILFPHYLAPLVWGSFTFLVDPWNYRRGARSILRDLEARDWGLFARVFVAGLACGLLWESFNFFAPQKWIYTVRGLENFKLFEMPLLGFLGFPALAFDCLAAFSLLSYLFLGNETWEHPEDLSYSLQRRARPSRLLLWGSLAVQPVFWAIVAHFLFQVNVGSTQLELTDLDLSLQERNLLEVQGIRRPRQLLQTARDPERRAELGRRLDWSAERTREILDRAELYTFKGIGKVQGQLLERIGVGRVRDLRAWEPEDLYARLRRESRSRAGWELARLDMVRVWVLASQSGGILMR